MQSGFFQLAQDEPELYLALDLGIAFALGTLAFFWKDISDWMERQRMAGNYQSLNDDDDQEEQKPMASAQTLRMELFKTINVIEEVQHAPHTLLRSLPLGPPSPSLEDGT